MGPAKPGNTNVADNIVVNRQGFRAVITEEEEHVICHPIDVEELDTSWLGVNLPWAMVGAVK